MLFEKYRLVAMPPARWAELIVDEEKCDGCGRCAKACPVQLLEVKNKVSKSNERYDVFRCLTCENCSAVCPQNALTIEKDYRVPQGFWKNEHLFKGTKTLPAPLGMKKGEDFEDYKGELTGVEQVIYQRRSNRLFRKKQVAPEIINRIIEAGRFAPSAGNNQPWKFIVVQNPAVLEELKRKSKKTLRFFSKLCIPESWMEKKTPGDKNAASTLPLVSKCRASAYVLHCLISIVCWMFLLITSRRSLCHVAAEEDRKGRGRATRSTGFTGCAGSV